MTQSEDATHPVEGATDILAEDEVVHVPAAVAELAQATQHHGNETFVADIPDWDKADPLP